ncbi:hypothetical protein A3E44_03085 [Candidatus Woesebacteria bacterium RIFCSPHIGHO2_12_FULL_41_24]|uniref:SpoVT-AbrB domain-containing protein n=1 Tax=Candidatus Woesebacteria bacterium RIFCSPHIGHO2_12_FULL_41_24 TaxID=1802510 RepID=A0A1F8AU19_9BACT|nr:MAG: hypothetical protein A3E44_03085 [Candidatus Woesebacteria bacterium RIFCSPHIGHO2_12_FULL_41_24]OGM71387.1 MAG: hypothetical protein A3I55_01490 [Candidatus Woesebacteria bacterium RIFCSPLOWO2_02_FULL_42_10]
MTIPRSYLEVLGLESYGKAILEKEKDKVVIRPMKGSVVDQVAGSLRGYVRPSLLGKSVEEINKEAGEAYTKYLAKKFKLIK